MATAIAAPSPSAPPWMARWKYSVAIRWVAFTGPLRVITTAMMGVSSGRVT